jgi:hypothetical protein
MAVVNICPVWVGERFANANNILLAGGGIWTYVAGSFSSMQTTYSDSAGTVPNANPIPLDASGLLTAAIWLIVGNAYNMVLKDAQGNVIDFVDNVYGVPLLPPQAGNAGNVLSTNGAGILSWISSGGGGSIPPTFIISLSTDQGAPLGDGPLPNGSPGAWTSNTTIQAAAGYSYAGGGVITLPDSTSAYQVTMMTTIFENSGEGFNWLGSHGSQYGTYVSEATTNGSLFIVGPTGADGNIFAPTTLTWTTIDIITPGSGGTCSPNVWLFSASEDGGDTTMGLSYLTVITITKIG